MILTSAISMAFALSNMVQTALSGNDNNFDCYSDGYFTAEYHDFINYSEINFDDYVVEIPFNK